MKENWKYHCGDFTHTPKQIAAQLKNFNPDALIVRKGIINPEVIDTAKKLKIISKHGVGVDNIDVEYATKKGILVTITPHANFEAVSEHALALILSLYRRIPSQDKLIRSGIFDKTGYDGLEISGKTIGLIGYGRIGKRLSELMVPFHLQQLCFDPYINSNDLPDYMIQVTELDELLKKSDIISIHCPLTTETRGLIGNSELKKMKSHSIIVNTARGEIINEKALIEALQLKIIAGAALDTFEHEPPQPDNLLFQMENVIVTTHIGGMSDKSFRNMGMDAVENIVAVLYGQPLNSACMINPDVLKII